MSHMCEYRHSIEGGQLLLIHCDVSGNIDRRCTTAFDPQVSQQLIASSTLINHHPWIGTSFKDRNSATIGFDLSLHRNMLSEAGR
jgi:hypothetical protein